SSTLFDVAEAVRERRRLEVCYASRDHQITRRAFDPYGIVHTNRHWYTVGYCHLRQGIRIFRLDRLEVSRVTEVTFVPPEGFDPLTAVSQSLAQAPFPGSLACRVWLQTDLAEAAKHIPAYVATLEPGDGGVWLTVQAHPNWLSRVALYLLEFPFAVQVEGPDELKKALQKLAERTRKLSGGRRA
ncbi:MAG: WYL domain-containing protein, partial [Pleurocapsa sp. SU_196_0]|nr:WYL domain-containing protein [Pleurocapsa sp. SU_196_0]